MEKNLAIKSNKLFSYRDVCERKTETKVKEKIRTGESEIQLFRERQ